MIFDQLISLFNWRDPHSIETKDYEMLIVWEVKDNFIKVFKSIFEQCNKKGEMLINKLYPCDAPAVLHQLNWIPLQSVTTCK